MQKWIKPVLPLLAIAFCGCDSDGLSPREKSGASLSATVYSVEPTAPVPQVAQSTAGSLTVATPPQVALPMRVGVVQLGEVAPPQSMMDAFRRHSELFSQLEPLPGNLSESNSNSNGNSPSQDAAARQSMLTIRKTAADMGLTYILVYGGNVDQNHTSTALSVLDLTIVGYFIVPSQEITANGKAAGSLIDVSTGRVVRNVSVESRSNALLPSAVAGTSRDTMLVTVRDDLVRKMTEQTIARLGDSSISPNSSLK